MSTVISMATIDAASGAAPASGVKPPTPHYIRLGFEQQEFTGSNGKTLKYCIKEAGNWDAAQEKIPLVLFFHGAGERGDDNSKQLYHGGAQLTNYCKKNNVNALLVFPQCPNGKQWVDTPWDKTSHTMPEISESMDLAMQLLDALLKKYEGKVDPDRVYVMGISMGGYGTWDAISRFPEKFAAAFPVCGGVDEAQVEKFKHLPILFYHGDIDTIVPTVRSRNAAEALKKAGSTSFTYVEVPKCAHGSWGPAFRKKENWDWLFQQKRGKK